MNIDHVQTMLKDANKLNYQQLPGIVINTSTNDIANRGWFDNIPNGTLVVVQGRNNVGSKAVASFNSAQDLLAEYPLNTILYSGEMQLQDPETEYTRSMIIGIK